MTELRNWEWWLTFAVDRAPFDGDTLELTTDEWLKLSWDLQIPGGLRAGFRLFDRPLALRPYP